MAVIVVIIVGLAAAACANALYSRRNREDSLEKHERALNALRELAEHPQAEPEPLHTELPTDHVKILDERPEGTSPQRRRTRRAASARKTTARNRPRGIADRPTAAQLPRMPSSSPLTPPVVPPAKSPPPVTPEPVEVTAAPAPEPETPDPPRIAVPAVPIVFDDDIGEPEPRGALAPLSTRRAGFPAVPRSVAVAAAAALVAVLIASVTAFVVADESSGGPKRAASPPAAKETTTTTPPSTVTTTLPKPTAEFIASATGNGTVTVTMPFTLTLAATGAACWVNVEDATGKSVFSRTLQSGETQQVPGDGPLTVRLGNSKAIAMSVNGAPLNLAGVANTANVQFQPPA